MRRASRSAVGLLVVALLLLAFLGALRASPVHPTVVRGHGSESISITVGDSFSFSSNAIEVTPGDNLTFMVEQLSSSYTHTFTLSSVPNYTFPSSETPGQFSAFFAAHPPLVNFSFSNVPGTTYTKTVSPPAIGAYEFVCLQPGHFTAGMYGFVGVGVAVGPPSGPPPPTGVYIISGVIVALVVAAIVLGFVIGKREGSKYEMPPERLGYPEPPGTPSAPPGQDRPG